MNVIEKLTEIAQNEPKVYEAGKRAGRDDFWSRYLQNGGRTTNFSNQLGLFNGNNFGFSNFYPTYDIKPIGDASYLFYAWENKYKDSAGSLSERLKECGVVLDTSGATNLTLAFAYTHITELPTLDCTGLGSGSTGLFSHSYGRLKTIEKLIVNESVTFASWFTNANVQNLTFEGVIGQNLNLGPCTSLTGDSIRSTIGCLSDTATGKTLTLSKEAVETAFGSGNIQLSPSFDADFLANRGYTATDNQDGSVTVSGGTEQSGGYISFLPSALPQGTYELSHLETGEGAGVGLDVTIYDANGTPVSSFVLHSGNKTSITIEEGYKLSLEIGPYGEYDNKIFKPTLKRLEWESLQNSRPNWTISLV